VRQILAFFDPVPSGGDCHVDAVRKNALIDWTVKESVRAKMRTILAILEDLLI